MDEISKPRFEDVGPFCINEDECMVYECDADMVSDDVIYVAINHLDRIIRKPHFTEEAEAAIAQKRLVTVERNYTGGFA